MSFLYDKNLAYENSNVEWCSSMDLVGIVYENEKIFEMHICGYKHQKIYSK